MMFILHSVLFDSRRTVAGLLANLAILLDLRSYGGWGIGWSEIASSVEGITRISIPGMIFSHLFLSVSIISSTSYSKVLSSVKFCTCSLYWLNNGPITTSKSILMFSLYLSISSSLTISWIPMFSLLSFFQKGPFVNRALNTIGGWLTLPSKVLLFGAELRSMIFSSLYIWFS